MKKSPLRQLVKAEERIAYEQGLLQLLRSDRSRFIDELDATHKRAREEGCRIARAIYNSDLQQSDKLVKTYKQQLLDQAKRHQKRVDELKATNEKQAQQLMPMLGVSNVHAGLIVQNWHTAWKWISTWAFGLIAYVSVAGIPPEVLALVPEASQGKVTAALALLGFVGRFINQSRSKPLPPVQEET